MELFIVFLILFAIFIYSIIHGSRRDCGQQYSLLQGLSIGIGVILYLVTFIAAFRVKDLQDSLNTLRDLAFNGNGPEVTDKISATYTNMIKISGLVMFLALIISIILLWKASDKYLKKNSPLPVKRVLSSSISREDMLEAQYLASHPKQSDRILVPEHPIKEDDQARCPYCKSTSITANKKGFSAGKAIIGAAIIGPVGLVAGGIGSKKVMIICLKCGREWEAGSIRGGNPYFKPFG